MPTSCGMTPGQTVIAVAFVLLAGVVVIAGLS